jgi:phosphatidate cytidylyltransferase
MVDEHGKQADRGKLSNLAVRFATALVFLPGFLWLLYAGPWWGFFSLAAFAGLVAASELVGMTMPGARGQQVWGVLASAAVFAALYFAPNAQTLASALVAVVLGGFLVGLLVPDPIETAGARMAWLVTTPLYAGGLFATIALLHRLEDGGSWVVLACALAWLGDTFAYFAGRGFGRRKLYEKVSPKKTVEGAIGGLGGSIAGAVAMHFLFLDQMPLTHAVPLAVVAGVLGQAGDLTVSLIKRSAKVKDSGWIVPGHGGLLDRADALVMTAAVTWAYATWLLPDGSA